MSSKWSREEYKMIFPLSGSFHEHFSLYDRDTLNTQFFISLKSYHKIIQPGSETFGFLFISYKHLTQRRISSAIVSVKLSFK
jgi:hypothetical protein